MDNRINKTELVKLANLIEIKKIVLEQLLSSFSRLAKNFINRIDFESDNLALDIIFILTDIPTHSTNQNLLVKFIELISLSNDPQITDWINRNLGLNSNLTDNQQVTQSVAETNTLIFEIYVIPYLAKPKTYTIKLAAIYNEEVLDAQQSNENDTIESLEKSISKLIMQYAPLQRCYGKYQMEVHFILPFELWSWPINNIQIPAGLSTEPLSKLYPVYIRSWERFYCNKYCHFWTNWQDKLTKLTQKETLKLDELIFVESTVNVTSLDWSAEKLMLVGTAHSPNISDKVIIFSETIKHGIPFIFWPTTNKLLPSEYSTEMNNLFLNHPYCDWPKLVHGYRKHNELWQSTNFIKDSEELKLKMDNQFIDPNTDNRENL